MSDCKTCEVVGRTCGFCADEIIQKYKQAFEEIYDEGLGLYGDEDNWIDN